MNTKTFDNSELWVNPARPSLHG